MTSDSTVRVCAIVAPQYGAGGPPTKVGPEACPTQVPLRAADIQYICGCRSSFPVESRMVRAKVLVLMLGAGTLGCVGPRMDLPVAPTPLAPPVMATLPAEPALLPRAGRSFLMKPGLVEDLMVAGSESDVRLLVGAVFGSGMADGRHTIGLALVFQAIGAPVEPALGVSHKIAVVVDGEVIVERDIDLERLYHREQGIETLVVPIEPAHLGDIVGADQVEMQLGTSLAFRLGDQSRRDFGELMSKITEDVNRVRRSQIAEHPLRKGL